MDRNIITVKYRMTEPACLYNYCGNTNHINEYFVYKSLKTNKIINIHKSINFNQIYQQ